MALKVNVVAKTDLGLVRKGNEDYLHVDEPNHVYAVCDGMGGHQAGEVASMTASETVEKAFNQFREPLSNDDRLASGRQLPPNGELLLRSIRLANRAIYNKSMANPNLSGMGTTIVAIAPENDILSIAHVGDSRAYRLQDSELEPLTKDHSWVAEIQESQKLSAEEAGSMVGKNVITRALGVRNNVQVDFRSVKMKPGEIFILCSDGLCGYADDDEIFDVAGKARADMTLLVDSLIQMANDRGGADNVSIIAMQVIECDDSTAEETAVFTLDEESEEVLAVADDWIGQFTAHDADAAQSDTSPTSIDGSGGGGPSKLMLLGLFVVFAVVAALILFFRPG